MIEVTRLNGTQILVNADLIELVEETPDTNITAPSIIPAKDAISISSTCHPC